MATIQPFGTFSIHSDLFNFPQGIADITFIIGLFGNYCGGNQMDGVLEIDSVLQHVRHTAQRLRFSADTALTQQILLLGDAFYGYRFTATDFTAVWSAADQMLKMYDRDGRMLGFFSPTKEPEESAVEPAAVPPSQRKAA